MIAVPKSVRLPSRVRLSYVDVGDPRSKDVLALLPGLSDSWRTWERVLPFVPPSIRVIAISLRGHGDSDKPETGYSVRAYAADLAAMLRALDVARPVVVGHSSASLVARRFALDHAADVAGIVLEGSFARLSRDVTDPVARRLAALADPVDPDFVREFVAGTLARPVDEAFVDAMVAESLGVPARVWRETFASIVDYDDSAELAKLEVATMIVWGERDAIVDRTATEELARTIPSSTRVDYEDVGHTPHWEEPERFARDLVAFALACRRGHESDARRPFVP